MLNCPSEYALRAFIANSPLERSAKRGLIVNFFKDFLPSSIGKQFNTQFLIEDQESWQLLWDIVGMHMNEDVLFPQKDKAPFVTSQISSFNTMQKLLKENQLHVVKDLDIGLFIGKNSEEATSHKAAFIKDLENYGFLAKA